MPADLIEGTMLAVSRSIAISLGGYSLAPTNSSSSGADCGRVAHCSGIATPFGRWTSGGAASTVAATVTTTNHGYTASWKAAKRSAASIAVVSKLALER